MDEPNESYGGRLRRWRKALDLTQEQLAERVSCSRYTIRKIEADERRPSRPLAERLYSRLDIPPHERDAFIGAARALRPTTRAAASTAASAVGATVDGDEPPWVDRGNHGESLGVLLERLDGGSGYVVLIEGEPGIGKSRLIRELIVRANACRVSVLTTRCYEMERTVAYQPVIDLATQAAGRASLAMLSTLGSIALAEIASLVPAVAARVPVASISSDFMEARQARLFRALLALFDVVGGGRPLLLVVDDLQWADEASGQFLHWLACRAAPRPLMTMYALRDDDIRGDDRLATLVASLRAEPHSHHVALQRFDLAQTRALLTKSADPALAERLHQETEGNPFFLVSLMQALRQGASDMGTLGAIGTLALPDALRAALSLRLAHVPASARHTLELAAVLGRRFVLDALLEVTNETQEQVVGALEVLVARRLLREADDQGAYDFTHDKLREVAYLEISAGRRLLLHRAVAEVLERNGDSQARIAEHWERGGMWVKALRSMVRAGERSQQLFALRAALQWFDRALELARSRPDALAGTAVIDLYDARGAARAQAGQTEGAVEDLRRVIVAARQAADRNQVRDTLIRLGMTYRRADRYQDALAALDEALVECRAMNDERHAADTLYHLGTVAWSDGHNREATAFHEEAVSICERLRLADLVAVQAHHGRGEAYFLSLEPRSAIACYERSTALARSLGDKSYECENEMMVAYACTGALGLGDYPRAETAFQLALDIAETADLQWHTGPTLLGLNHVRACTGRYGQAWTGMSRTLQWLEGMGHVRYELMALDLMACLAIDVGQHMQAVDFLERAAEMAEAMKIRFWQPRIGANLAIASVRMGRLDVEPMLERALAQAASNGETAHLARCLEAAAESALARGDVSGCQRRVSELMVLIQGRGLAELEASARCWRGRAFAASGDNRAAAAELVVAEAQAKRLGRVRLAFDISLALESLGHEPIHAAHVLARSIEDSLAGSELQAALPACRAA